MKLCFLEGCDLEAQITVQKTVNTSGQIGDSSCDLCMPFCSVEHALVFERMYPTVTEQMAAIARFAASFEAESLTLEQLDAVAESLRQIIDINIGGQGMVILAREEFEALDRSQRMLAGTQRQLNRLQRLQPKPHTEP